MITDVLRFIMAADGGVSLGRLRAKFPSVAPVLRICFERELLELRGGCYHATQAGAVYLTSQPPDVPLKHCPGCDADKARSEFWKDAARPDGLYAYCIDCCNRRKARVMEQRQLEARGLIRAAGSRIVGAAAQWDAAVAALAAAWHEVMAVDDVLRANRGPAKIDVDYGRMEARLLHPRAMFALSIALTDAQFPLGYPVHRDCGMPEKLAEYVGEYPERDYVAEEQNSSSCIPSDELGGAGAPVMAVAPAPSPRRTKRHRSVRRARIAPVEAPA